jgi:hypothetical protein
MFGRSGYSASCCWSQRSASQRGSRRVEPAAAGAAELDRKPGVSGSPSRCSREYGKPGFFTVRAKFPPNYQLGPHTHTDDRGLTIRSWKRGIGAQFDAAKAVSMPGKLY